MATYEEFLQSKMQSDDGAGFEPISVPDSMFPFQAELLAWSTRKGRAAIFADCGLGKTLMQLAWADNVVRKTNGRVLVLTPLAVGRQTVREGEKFGIECTHSRTGKIATKDRIIVTNYERLHYFNHSDFDGVVCDESSILKSFDGATRKAITEFMRLVGYRLLCTATAAPNDFIELGTSSEALGELGHMDMLSKFFKNDQGSNHPNRKWAGGKWRFRGHAEMHFWRWVCSWARAIRSPADLGYDDGEFKLPDLETNQYVVTSRVKPSGRFFVDECVTLQEQRRERRDTLKDRCEKAAELVAARDQASVCWCHLNSEGDLLESMIPDAVQVSGKDTDEKKEEAFLAFQDGQIKTLVTKPTIAGFGLNWQHCSYQTFFPSHSFEQWYQAIRRSWRFGQRNKVVVEVITSQGEARVLRNLQRKAQAASEMFSRLVETMKNEMKLRRGSEFPNELEVPSWL